MCRVRYFSESYLEKRLKSVFESPQLTASHPTKMIGKKGTNSQKIRSRPEAQVNALIDRNTANRRSSYDIILLIPYKPTPIMVLSLLVRDGDATTYSQEREMVRSVIMMSAFLGSTHNGIV